MGLLWNIDGERQTLYTGYYAKYGLYITFGYVWWDVENKSIAVVAEICGAMDSEQPINQTGE